MESELTEFNLKISLESTASLLGLLIFSRGSNVEELMFGDS